MLGLDCSKMQHETKLRFISIKSIILNASELGVGISPVAASSAFPAEHSSGLLVEEYLSSCKALSREWRAQQAFSTHWLGRNTIYPATWGTSELYNRSDGRFLPAQGSPDSHRERRSQYEAQCLCSKVDPYRLVPSMEDIRPSRACMAP